MQQKYKSDARLFARGRRGRPRRAGYLLYERQHREVLKIDVPGFSGEITKDKAASTSRSAKTASACVIPAKPIQHFERAALIRLAPYDDLRDSTAAPVSSPWRKRRAPRWRHSGMGRRWS